MTLTLKIVNQFFCMTYCHIIIHQNAKFGQKWLSSSGDTVQTQSDTQRKYHPDKHSLTFWTFAVTLTLDAVIQFFHRTLWFMMLYYQTKFGCNQTSSLEGTTEIVIFWLYKPSLWPWYWTQWTNFSAWHSSLWCCKTIPDLATKWFRRYHPDKHSLTFLTFTVTLTLKAVIPFFHSLWCCTTKPNLVANQPAV